MKNTAKLNWRRREKEKRKKKRNETIKSIMMSTPHFTICESVGKWLEPTERPMWQSIGQWSDGFGRTSDMDQMPVCCANWKCWIHRGLATQRKCDNRFTLNRKRVYILYWNVPKPTAFFCFSCRFDRFGRTSRGDSNIVEMPGKPSSSCQSFRLGKRGQSEVSHANVVSVLFYKKEKKKRNSRQTCIHFGVNKNKRRTKSVRRTRFGWSEYCFSINWSKRFTSHLCTCISAFFVKSRCCFAGELTSTFRTTRLTN